MFSPLQVYFLGIELLDSNALLKTFIFWMSIFLSLLLPLSPLGITVAAAKEATKQTINKIAIGFSNFISFLSFIYIRNFTCEQKNYRI
jgi:hypothetical protein